MMNKIYQFHLSPNPDLDERDLIEGALQSCFDVDEMIFLICYREDSLNILSECLRLRDLIPVEFEAKGCYKIVDFLDDTRFSSICMVPYHKSNIDLIESTLNYFYSVVLCKSLIDFESFFFDEHNWFESDLFFRKKVIQKKLNYCFVKGEAGDFYLTFNGDENESKKLLEKLKPFYTIETVI